jgi:hypothetical protein
MDEPVLVFKILFWEFFEINPGDKTPVLQKKTALISSKALE